MQPGATLIVRGERVVTAAGVRPAAVVVTAAQIVAVVALEDLGSAAAGEAIDAGDALVLPGLVDAHVHVNEPGRTDWEGFASATRAAAAGGVTTLVDMPLNSVPATTTVAALDAKGAAARGQCRVDVGFWGGVVPGNVDQLEPLWRAGVRGFKCFLAPSGVDDFPAVDAADLALALPVLARLGAPLLVHAELPSRLGSVAPGERRHAAWAASRPPEAEAEAVALLGRLAREHGARIHVVHLSAAESLVELAAARAAGAAMSAETCPHYLSLAAEEVPDGATAFKCAPPLREERHREALWQALLAGELALVASDHSPSPPAGKALASGDFAAAWGGIAGLQLLLPALWTSARERGAEPADLARWLAAAPAALAGLAARKGTIAAGQDADLVVWQPEEGFTVDPALLYHRHPLTPWAGRRLAGVVRRTILRGETIYRDGELVGEPRGEQL